MHPADSERFARAIALFDAANAEDPRTEQYDGQAVPRELLYARRMTEMLERFAPDASEAVKLGVRAQHIQRWRVPRESFPMDRAGYLQWRSGLYGFHAKIAGQLLREAGYGEDVSARVEAAVGKKGLTVNPESQLVEDVADLVFLEHYMLAFAVKNADYSEEKWIGIIRKTWAKMSERARAFALSEKVQLPEPLAPLLRKAVGDS